MSGTILYLAIVAIWAGVLVPRWLRRDPHRDSRARRASMAESLALSDVPGASDALADDILDAEVAREGSAVRPRGGAQGGRVPSSAARRPGSVVTARRRLLGMLVVLEVTAAAVAAVGAAAWWVVAPPTGMLAVFLTLLREAARADAELTQARTLRAQSSSPTSAASAASVSSASTSSASTPRRRSAMGATVAAVAAAVGSGQAKVVDITERVSEEPYDQYADAKLRAVGD